MSMGNKNSVENNSSVKDAEENHEEIDNVEYSSSDEDDDQRSFLVLVGEDGEGQQHELRLPELDSRFGSTRTASPAGQSKGLHDFLNEQEQLNLAMNMSLTFNRTGSNIVGTSSQLPITNTSQYPAMDEQMSTSETERPPQSITGRHLSDAIRAADENVNFSGVRPIKIVSFNEDGELVFEGRKWLQEMAKSPKYKDKLILPIVDAGQYRQGKSTTVNLKAEAFEMRGNSRPLQCGFEWSGGDLAITNGILCWPEPIQVPLPIGEGGSLVDVLILLFDVQGFFDATESHIDIRLCTIANLISTIFVYNLKHPFDSQHLHSLQKMLTLGLSVVDKKLEKEIENEKGQNEIQQNIHLQIPVLYLIVRDCPRPAKICGTEGGKRVLDRWIKNPPATTNGDLLASAKYLLDLYQLIDCFCLPRPAEGLIDGILEERLRIESDSLPSVEEIGRDYLEMNAKLADEILAKIGSSKQLFNIENFVTKIEKVVQWTKNKDEFNNQQNSLYLQQERINRKCLFEARNAFDNNMLLKVDSGKVYLKTRQFNQYYEESVNCEAIFATFQNWEFVDDATNRENRRQELVHNYLTYCQQRYWQYKRLNESNKGWGAVAKEAAFVAGIAVAGTVVGGGLGGLVGVAVAGLARAAPAVTVFATNITAIFVEGGTKIFAGIGITSGFFGNLSIHKFWKRKYNAWRNKNQKLPYHEESFVDALDAAIRQDPNHFFSLGIEEGEESENEDEASQSGSSSSSSSSSTIGSNAPNKSTSNSQSQASTSSSNINASTSSLSSKLSNQFLKKFTEIEIVGQIQTLRLEHPMNEELLGDLLSSEMERNKQLTMEQIHGNEEAKRIMERDCIRPFLMHSNGRSPVGFSALEMASKCILLYGEPGNGKTMMAQALAHRCGATLFIVTADRILNMYVGQSERATRLVFSLGTIKQPAVIFFDEIDSLIGRRKDSDKRHDTQLMNTFLTCINEIGDKQILVVGATNRIEAIDSAALDRFPIRLQLELPNGRARYEYILATFARYNVQLTVEKGAIEIIAAKLNGYSYRSLMSFCSRVARNCRERIGPEQALAISEEDLLATLTQK